MAAGFAHEIRNPLTSTKGVTQLLFERHHDELEDDGGSLYQILLQEIDRTNQILMDFTDLARPRGLMIRLKDIQEGVRSTVRLSNPVLEEHRIEVAELYESEPVPTECDQHRIRQVLIHLVRNAVDAMPDGGKLILRLERGPEYCVVTVEDTGTGIDEELLPKLGTPYLTTREHGTGLGLAVTQQVIQDHGGRMGADPLHPEPELFPGELNAFCGRFGLTGLR